METYEYPLGTTFRASTPERAAAKVLGGKPSDYETDSLGHWIEVTDAHTGEWLEDIPVVSVGSKAERWLKALYGTEDEVGALELEWPYRDGTTYQDGFVDGYAFAESIVRDIIEGTDS